MSEHVRDNFPNLPEWRRYTSHEKLILDDMKQSKLGYDEVT